MKFTESSLSLFLVAIVSAASAADILGVSEQDASKYQPDSNGKWACLGHPEIVLSFSQVNDDICDCPDGSDEPGTAACPDNIFYCRNKGHIPGKLPSNRVNDGVCDYDVCCDGSDEAGLVNSLKGTDLEFKCENRCAQIHKEYIERLEAERQLLKDASDVRTELLRKAINARVALQKELDTKEEKLGQLKQKLAEKEKTLREVESRDLELKKKQKSNGNVVGEKPPIVVEAREVLDKISEAYKQASDEVSRLNQEIGVLSTVLEKMKTEYNPNFNDPAVKQAIRSFEEYKANTGSNNEARTLDHSETSQKVPKVLEGLENYRAPVAGSGSSSLVGELKKTFLTYSKPALLWLAENGIISYGFEETFAAADNSGSEEDGAELKLHKNIVKKAQEELSELQTQIDETRASYTTSYGPNDILRSLKDTCVSDDLGEYTYEFCYYGGVRQKSNKDSSTVDLGKFDNLSYNKEKNSLVLNFENGAKCWSGPIRRATVTLTCGKEDKILQVTEPERCEYFIRGISPAACDEYKEDSVAAPKLLSVHDEL